MSSRWILLVLLFFLVGTTSPATEVTTPRISLQPADPPTPELQRAMVRWRRSYRLEMAPVRRHWGRVVATVHNGRISELASVCPGFRQSLAELDRERLLEVADPVVRAWLSRGLALLDSAAHQCRRDRFFSLGFRLYKARHVIDAVDRRLEKYG